MKFLLLAAIRFYQRAWFWRPPVCRFRPSCSEYSYQAITKYGTIKGLDLSWRRIIRCHPWSRGGDDPVK